MFDLDFRFFSGNFFGGFIYFFRFWSYCLFSYFINYFGYRIKYEFLLMRKIRVLDLVAKYYFGSDFCFYFIRFRNPVNIIGIFRFLDTVVIIESLILVVTNVNVFY